MEKKTRMTHNEIRVDFDRLRHQAEDRIKRWPNLASLAGANLLKVIHELRIHLAELEIQNEELRQAMREMNEQNEENSPPHQVNASW